MVADEFTPLEGMKQVVLYGSWAARYEGAAGPPPGDVDVMVVGRRSETAWASASDALVAAVQAAPMVTLIDNPEAVV